MICLNFWFKVVPNQVSLTWPFQPHSFTLAHMSFPLHHCRQPSYPRKTKVINISVRNSLDTTSILIYFRSVTYIGANSFSRKCQHIYLSSSHYSILDCAMFSNFYWISSMIWFDFFFYKLPLWGTWPCPHLWCVSKDMLLHHALPCSTS